MQKLYILLGLLWAAGTAAALVKDWQDIIWIRQDSKNWLKEFGLWSHLGLASLAGCVLGYVLGGKLLVYMEVWDPYANINEQTCLPVQIVLTALFTAIATQIGIRQKLNLYRPRR